MDTPHDIIDPAEQLIAGRLRALNALPVDTTRLDAGLLTQLPSPLPPRIRIRRLWRPTLAIAAALLLLLFTATLALMSRQAQASPDMMAQMHRDILSGKIPTMRADSIDDANRAIAAMAGNFPRLPQPPASHTMACCMKNVGNKRVACVLLDNAGTPVTMVVADAADVQSPNSPTLLRNGITYHIQTVSDLHMVMTQHQHLWICLIAALPPEKLMDLADQLQF